MSKQLFPLSVTRASAHRGNNDANLAGTASWWSSLLLSESRGTVVGPLSLNTATGPTNGIEFISSGAVPIEWISEPLSADFTIAGTITVNLWALETSMSANAGINVAIDKIDGATGALTRIATSANATELGTAQSANNFTVTPTSTLCHRGDRLRIRVFIKDAGGTLTTGFSTTLDINGPTAAADGDSWVQFTENLTFEPSGDPPAVSQNMIFGVSGGISFGWPTVVQRQAQQFIAQGDFSLLHYKLQKTGAPTDNVVIEIQTDSAGAPSGTVVGTIATVAAASLTTTMTQYTASAAISLTAGQKYWIVFRRSGTLDQTNSYLVSEGNPIAGSGLYRSGYDGTSWNVSVLDALDVQIDGPFAFYLTNTALLPYEGAAQPATGNAFGDPTTGRIAQQFTATGGTLTELRATLRLNNAPTDNVIIEVQTDASNLPSGTVVGTVATVAAASLTGSQVQYTYACSIPLTVGTKYWIVFRRSGALASPNYYLLTPPVSGGSPLGLSAIGPTTWATTPGYVAAVRLTYNSKTTTTTRGSGSVNAITNTAAGPVTPIQVTTTAGGTAIEWYTPLLQAFTLGGKTKFNIHALESNFSANASLKAEIAICNNDGTGAVVWGIANVAAVVAGSVGEIGGTTDTLMSAWVAGDDTAISVGQRLRFRIFVDDCGDTPLVTGFTATVSYNGATAAAAGDTYILLPVAALPLSPGVSSGTIAATSTVGGSIRLAPVTRPITPATISATSTVGGNVTKRPLIKPTTSVLATSTVSGAVARLKQVVPTTAVAATSTVSGSLRALRRVAPTTVAATSTVGGSVRATHLIAPTTVIAATSTVSGNVVARRRVAPTTIISATSTVSGAIVPLRGIRPTTTVLATSTVSGVITKGGGPHPIIPGIIAATSVVSGGLVFVRRLPVATIAATSTVAGVVGKLRPLTANVAATSTVSGSVHTIHKIVPTVVAATSVVSGVVTKAPVKPITGTIAAISTVSGGLRFIRRVAPALVAATSTVGGTIIHIATFRGASVAATSVVSGFIVKGALSPKAIVPTLVSATSTVSGRVITTHRVAGAVAATSTVSGIVAVRRFIIATNVAALSTVQGLVKRAAAVRPTTILATSTVAGTVTTIHRITGVISATSTVTGSVLRHGAIVLVTSVVNAVSTVSGLTTAIHRLTAATILATSAIAGIVRRLRPITPAQVNATSVVSGTVRVIRRLPLITSISATSTVTGNVRVIRRIVVPANVLATSTVQGSVVRKIRVQIGNVLATSTVSGTIVNKTPGSIMYFHQMGTVTHGKTGRIDYVTTGNHTAGKVGRIEPLTTGRAIEEVELV